MKANRKKLELAMARACMNSADLPAATHTILPLEVHFVTVRQMQVSQRFESEDKVLFDTFSFKKKYQRYLPVTLSRLERISSGVPHAMTRPPWTPPPGPMSMQ